MDANAADSSESSVGVNSKHVAVCAESCSAVFRRIGEQQEASDANNKAVNIVEQDIPDELPFGQLITRVGVKVGQFERQVSLSLCFQIAVLGKAHILVVDSPEGYEPDRAEDVETCQEDAIEWLVTRPPIENVGAIFGHRVANTLEQAPQYKIVQSEGEWPTVPEQHPAEVPEARDGVVCKRSGLVALFAHETEADMSLLDHVDIVGSVADCSCNFFVSVVLHETDDLGFLRGRRSVYYRSLS